MIITILMITLRFRETMNVRDVCRQVFHYEDLLVLYLYVYIFLALLYSLVPCIERHVTTTTAIRLLFSMIQSKSHISTLPYCIQVRHLLFFFPASLQSSHTLL